MLLLGMRFLNGLRHDPALCQEDFLFLRSLAKSLEVARDRHVPARVGLILDVGSSYKPYYPLFQDRCAQFSATDYGFQVGVEHRHHVLNSISSAESLPFRDGCADVVLCTQVLEHVDDYDVVLAELARVLKPGGVAFISTHGVFHHHPYPQDHWRFTSTGLEKVVRRRFPDGCLVMPNGGTMLLLCHLVGRGVYSMLGRRRGLRWLRYTAYPLVNLLGLALDRFVPDHSLSINYLAVAWKK